MMDNFSKVYKEKFKFTKIQKILISASLILLIFGIFTRVSGGNAVSKFGYDAFSMMRYSIVDSPIKTVTNVSSDINNLWSLQKENDELRSKLASQKLYETQLNEAKRKLKELEALTKVTSNDNFESIAASVISRDIQGWSNSLTINVGSKQGITKDMAVITSQGLAGKVIEVNSNTAKVRLLTAEKETTNVSIKIQINDTTTTEGFLEGYDKASGKYIVNIFESNVELKSGMTVLTSGKGGLFPSGLLIGKVSEIKDLYNAEGKAVLVEPSVDFNNFDYMSVLRVK